MNITNEAKLASPRRMFIFWRGTDWYPIELPEDTVADNAASNPGTTKVTAYPSGKVVWEAPIP